LKKADSSFVDPCLEYPHEHFSHASAHEIEAMLEDSSSSLHSILLEMYGSRDCSANRWTCSAARSGVRSVPSDGTVACSFLRSTGRINLLGFTWTTGRLSDPIANQRGVFHRGTADDDRVVLRDIDGERFPEGIVFRISELPAGGQEGWRIGTAGAMRNWKNARASRASHSPTTFGEGFSLPEHAPRRPRRFSPAFKA